MHIGFKHPVPAVAAIILRGREILLVKRGGEPGLGKWSAPGGSMEIGETLQEALKREVREETGLEIEVGKLASVSDLIVKQDNDIAFHYVLIDYYATVVSGNLIAATDALDCRWVSLDEIRKYDVTASLIDRLRDNGLID
jgi:ADP-ribose pyrophosphatase YjhB (NUDIX family)